MKIRKPKNDDLQYRTITCRFCNAAIIKTIEHQHSCYWSPALIVGCPKCDAEFVMKYEFAKFNLVHIEKERKIMGQF